MIPPGLLGEVESLLLRATAEEVAQAEGASSEDEVRYAVYQRVTAAVAGIPPARRWPLAVPEDRWALAGRIARYRDPSDISAEDTCRRWCEALAEPPPATREEVKSLLKKGPSGSFAATPLNLYLILKRDPDLRGRICWNDYAREVEVCGTPFFQSAGHDLQVTVSSAQVWLDAEYGVCFGRDDVGHQLALVAGESPYNPLRNYLLGLRWDGVSRIDRFFVDYFGAADTAHYRRIGRRWVVGAVGRALPTETWSTCEGKRMGMKFDNIPILEAVQGEKKDSAWEVLGGRFYCSSSIVVGDKDSKMLAASSWFVHLPELASFKKAEREGVKAFATARQDTYRAPYGRGVIHVPRQCLFAASTNDEHYLDDETGNRRYWCVKCGRIDLARLMRDRDQIWAEAVAVFLGEMDCQDCWASEDTVIGQRPRCGAHRWWLDRDEEADAAGVAEERQKENVFEGAIRRWWVGLAPSQRPHEMTTEEVAKDALEMTIEKVANRDVFTKIGFAMKRIGFEKGRGQEVAGKRPWVFRATEALLRVPKESRRGLFVVPGGKAGGGTGGAGGVNGAASGGQSGHAPASAAGGAAAAATASKSTRFVSQVAAALAPSAVVLPSAEVPPDIPIEFLLPDVPSR